MSRLKFLSKLALNGIITEEGNSLNTQWDDLMAEYSKVYPTEHELLQRLMANELPEDFTHSFETFLENLQTGEKKGCCNQKSF